MNESYDVAIIGAGSAGLSALREVRKQTERFVLINDGPYGTTCARVGCMPSKALIEAAGAYHRRHALAAFGVSGADGLAVDIAAVLRRVRQLRDGFVDGVLKLTDALGERSIAGHARFVEPHVLAVGKRRIAARKIIIATGSRPVVPDAWAALGTRILTSDDLFEQKTLPSRMAVVGLGSLGMEMAQALARLGIDVAGFNTAAQLAGLSDPRVNEAAVALFREALTLHLGEAAELEAAGEQVRVRTGSREVLVDKVLVALGRRPNVDDLGLDKLGVTLDDKGMPPFDPLTLQVADLDVYIAGDANQQLPLLHEAADEGYVAGYNACRDAPACFERRTPLAIVFSDPNIAVVGQSYAQLDPAASLVGEADFSSQGRARMAIENYGLVRVYADKSTGRLLGAELCVAHGEHLAHLLAWAVQQKLTVQDVLRLPFYHPVIEEGLRTALRDLAGQIGEPPGADLANCKPSRADALD
jgi:dihydrolipoamide dehydrogenase